MEERTPNIEVGEEIKLFYELVFENLIILSEGPSYKVLDIDKVISNIEMYYPRLVVNIVTSEYYGKVLIAFDPKKQIFAAWTDRRS